MHSACGALAKLTSLFFILDINSISRYFLSLHFLLLVFSSVTLKKDTRTITLAKIIESGDDKKLTKCSEERKKERQLKSWSKVLFRYCCRSGETARRIQKNGKGGRAENFHLDHCPWGCEWHLIWV